MGVSDGQNVSAAITNPAFINKNIDDTTPSRLGLGSTITAQGPAITWAQQQFNSLASFLGAAINGVYNLLPTWTHNYVGSSSDNVFTRTQALVALFSGSTGHTHDGTDGDGSPVLAASIASVPYKGYGIQGTNYTSSAANSDNVTSLLTGRGVSTGITVLGVVSNTPYNKTVLRNSTTGDLLLDALGNAVYGRLTFATSVWTHSYYSLVAGTETAYTFLATTPIEWFFQQIYNPLNGAPTYDPAFIIPSANATADIETATSSVQGKTQLATATPSAIAGTGSAGTANATVANADHTHAGVSSIVGPSTTVQGAMTFTGAGVTQSSNTFTFTGGAGGGGALRWVEDASAPSPANEFSDLCYFFVAGASQALWALLKVPTSYVSGSPINLKMDTYTPDVTGTNLLISQATLIRQGTDAMNSTTNQHSSTNTAVTVNTTANVATSLLLDLTDSSGKINSVSVSPGDLIKIEISRGTDTATSDIRLPAYAEEVTFS